MRNRVLAIAMSIAALMQFSVWTPALAATVQAQSRHLVTTGTGLRVGVMPKSGGTTARGPAVAAAPAGAHLTYYGGKVISNVNVIQVLYGSGTYTPEVQNTAAPSIASFYAGVTNSSYYDWLAEYNTTVSGGTNQVIGRGTFAQQIQITPSAANSGASVDDTQIQPELRAQITAGHLPMPSGNTLYAVYFPANVTITQGGSASGVQFCAYHGTVAAGSTPEFYYSVLPDFTTGGMTVGCGNGTRFQNETSVSSHELVEATTDAEVGLATVVGPPLAWYDSVNGEIGDICNGVQQAIVGGDGRTYTVQQEWSNAQNNCVVNGPAVSDFSISANPASVSVTRGASGTSTISTTVTSGSAQTVNLSASGLPAGATASFSPASIAAGGSSTLTITTAASTPTGTSTVTVTGTGTSRTHTTSIALTVTAAVANDFSISANPASVSVAQGGSGTSNIATAITSGSAVSVSLSASGLPSGASASFSPNPVNSGASSTLTITTSSSTPAGTSTITVTGTGPSSTHTATVSLTVTATTTSGIVNGGFETGNLSGWTSTGTTAVVGSGAQAGTFAARVGGTAPTNGDSSIAQTFSAPSGANRLQFYYNVVCPDSLTYDWATATLRDNTSSTTVTVLPKTCVNGSGWTLVGTAITGGHSYTLTLISHDDNYAGDPTYTLYDSVSTSATSNDFSIAANPSSVSATQGTAASTTISTTVTSGSAQGVSLSASGLPAGAAAGFNPASVNSGGSSTLTLSTASTTPAGTYSVTVTGTGASATHSTTVSLTVTPVGTGPVVTNGGFETGTFSGWTTAGAAESISNSGHSGSHSALLGSTNPTNGDSTISQTVSIPSTATTLTFWYATSCPDTLTYDWFTMQIRSTGGATLATPQARVCPTAYAWTQVTYNVTAFRGQTVRLWFANHDDNYTGDPTYTLVDDVSVN